MSFFDESKIVNASDFSNKRCKATIQKTGKLGFTATAATVLCLQEGQRLLVSDAGDGNLAVVVLPGGDDVRGFPIRKASQYFTVDMKAYFDQKGIDYQKSDATIIYDIVALGERYRDLTVYKLTKRIKNHRKVKEEPKM